MADIALLVVEEFERGAKRAAMLAQSRRQEVSDAGCRQCSSPRSAPSKMKKKQGAWAAVGASATGAEPGGKLGLAAADGFFSA